MRPAVHENLTIAVDVAFEEEEQERPGLDNPPRVRSLARDAGRQAIRLGIVFRHAFPCELFSPGLKGKLFALLQRIVDVVDEIAIRSPDAGEIRLTIRCPGGGPSLGLLSAFCLCSACLFLTCGGQQRDQG